jgi:hypothetical protein
MRGMKPGSETSNEAREALEKEENARLRSARWRICCAVVLFAIALKLLCFPL